MPSKVRPIFLDCDTGIDDSLAIAYLAAADNAELVGIGAVSGNVASTRAAQNTLDLLAMLGCFDVPVAVGADAFLEQPFHGGAPDVHGDDGVGGVGLPRSALLPVDESAVDLLLRLSWEHDGELDIITTGPLTNLALALIKDPTLPARVRRVTTMGGAALVIGNITPVAEANVYNDPDAAAVVLAADWDITLVPLDVTVANRFEEEDRKALLASQAPVARKLGDMLDHYFDFYVGLFGYRGCALHDPLAVAIALGDIKAVRAPAVEIVVDTTKGPGRGQTICDLRGQAANPGDRPGFRSRVVLETDRPFAPLLRNRILGSAS